MKQVPLAAIRLDGGTQTRASMDGAAISDYAEVYRRTPQEMPPVELWHDGETYWPGDGFHRIYGAMEADRQHIDANVHKGGQVDALRYALGANATHGLPRSQADKRNAVVLALRHPEFAGLGSDAIAKLCKVSWAFADSVRAQLGVKGPTVRGRDGKTYPVRSQQAPAREPEPEKEPEPEPEAATPATPLAVYEPEPDGDSAPTVAAFDLAPEFASCQTLIAELAKRINAMSQKPGGEHLHLSEFKARFDGLRDALSAAKPKRVCTTCQGESSVCKTCGGLGWEPAGWVSRGDGGDGVRESASLRTALGHAMRAADALGRAGVDVEALRDLLRQAMNSIGEQRKAG